MLGRSLRPLGLAVRDTALSADPMRSILPDKTRSRARAARNRANLMLDDPQLIVRMKDFGSTASAPYPVELDQRERSKKILTPGVPDQQERATRRLHRAVLPIRV